MSQLFSATLRPGPKHPPVNLVCQSLEQDGELHLWVDGMNLEDPVLLPISAAKQIRLLGTFREFAAARLDLARAVLQESQGEHSPTLLARAMLLMQDDPRISANDALEHVQDQALDLIDADNCGALMFTDAQQELTAA